jgi:hypothetical protein
VGAQGSEIRNQGALPGHRVHPQDRGRTQDDGQVRAWDDPLSRTCERDLLADKLWPEFLQYTHSFMGAEWRNNGKVEKVEEIVKYCSKPADTLAALDDELVCRIKVPTDLVDLIGKCPVNMRS